MAAPRIFVSSTYYDLRQTRDNIKGFIEGLGYEAVMHEHSGVAYTQNTNLEKDCYREISGCEIVVSIIGNSFGSQSSENELSITMNEIKTAIKNKKKVYIFIANNVYIENSTYMQNKENGNFKSAYTDNIKIHQFIEELKTFNHSNVITPFDTTDQIINTLKSQFAGLLQNLLTREASLTEAKTAYDLQETVEKFKTLIEFEKEEKEEFLKKYDSSILVSNLLTRRIKKCLNMEKSTFFAKDLEALDEFMELVGYKSIAVDDVLEEVRKYQKIQNKKRYTISLLSRLFNEDGTVRFIKKYDEVDELFRYDVVDVVDEYNVTVDDDDLPF